MDNETPRRSSSQKLTSSSHHNRISIQMLFSLYKNPGSNHKRVSTMFDLNDNPNSSLSSKDFQTKQHIYPLLKLGSSGNLSEKGLLDFYNSRNTRLDHQEGRLRGKSGNVVFSQEGLPKCLKGVIQDDFKIKKLRRELKELKQELSYINVNLKVPYSLGFIDEKVYQLCKDPELSLVNEDEPLPKKIYNINDIKVLTKTIVKKVIRYHGIKQRISYLIDNYLDPTHHHNHIVLDKLIRKPAFPVQFEKQRGRPPLALMRFYPEKEKTKLHPVIIQNQEKDEMRKTFQNDELRKTHNFESYTERDFLMIKPTRSLHSSHNRRKTLN